MIEPKDDETLDDLLHGELKIIQKKRGVRYSVDALLLSYFSLPAVEGEEVLDMGCGAGTIALILAKRGNVKRMVGVEIQDSLAELARRNAELNPTQPKVEIIQADATKMEDLPAGSFGVVVTNPPFRPAGTGVTSILEERAMARHEILMTLESWLREAKRLIRPDGCICMIYPVAGEQRLRKTVKEQGLRHARIQYAVDRPRGRKRLVMVEYQPGPGMTRLLGDVAIETDQGRFSLDGYR